MADGILVYLCRAISMLKLGVWQVTNLSLPVVLVFASCHSISADTAKHEFINLGIAPKQPGPALAHAGGPGDLCQFCFQGGLELVVS